VSDEPSPLAGFTGSVRLFPLPNVVLFPHVVQPLHIFEPRYRQMTADALEGDRLIGMTLLEAGWEANYAGQPPIRAVGCLGHVIAEQRLEDGRFNILLRGLSRFRIEHEVVHTKQYRLARVSLLDDTSTPGPEEARKFRRRLLKVVPSWLTSQGAVLEHCRKLIKSRLPVGALCDIIAFALPLDVALKQELLEELCVEKRVKGLLRHLQKQEPQRKFPPEFSVN
jgi:Lon protease-like protein